MTAASQTHYTATAKLLHWLVAGAIVLQFVLAKLAERAADADQTVRVLGLLANHKSVGMTILALAIARVLWRITHTAPPLPAHMPRWQIGASHFSHAVLYGMIFAIPVSGWLMSSASAYSVSWFNLFTFPDLVAPDKDLKHLFEDIHEWLAKALFVVALIHILAAFKHALFDKDGILRRISSAPTISAFLVVIAAGVMGLTGVGTAPKPAAAPKAQTQTTAPSEVTAAASTLPLWNIDQEASRIEFDGDQAGAAFSGQWRKFEARIQFDADALDNARFDVTIDTISADTGDEERDTTMADAAWFDSENYATARYQAASFRQTDAGYEAAGQLLIKTRSVATPLAFTVTREGERITLIGNATLDRLAYGLGSGEWEDTTWVGQTVTVRVHIEATAPPVP
ncbi:MAG: cytochrome b/b6 domain-containing protein [Gammaproteobacteria bacterium]